MGRLITLAELKNTDFTLSGCEIYSCSWKEGEFHDYQETGRHQNLIHVVTAGEREYSIADRRFSVHSSTVLLIPDGTKYYTRTPGSCSGIGLCFDLAVGGEKITLVPDIYHGWQDSSGDVRSWMERFYEDTMSGRRGLLYRKMLLWRILERLLTEMKTDSALETVMTPAIRFIEAHYRENLPVAEYAEICHLSESHFRRKFVEYTGMTPIEYRDSLRFAEVRRLLEAGSSLNRTAELTGFWDASCLRRIYRKRTGERLLKKKENDFV
jgi:AraC-like DNA-binding protein